MTRCLAALLVTLAAATALAADDADARYRRLIDELRCLVCQNQTIADSSAPLAADLRTQVKAQIDAGRSDAEIVEYLTSRYGDFVLYRPPFKARTWLLWLGPFGVLVLAGVAAATFIRRSPAPVGDAAASADDVRRILEREKGAP
jgi:cytochrome c-type biogenesis protein CcmH